MEVFYVFFSFVGRIYKKEVPPVVIPLGWQLKLLIIL